MSCRSVLCFSLARSLWPALLCPACCYCVVSLSPAVLPAWFCRACPWLGQGRGPGSLHVGLPALPTPRAAPAGGAPRRAPRTCRIAACAANSETKEQRSALPSAAPAACGPRCRHRGASSGSPRQVRGNAAGFSLYGVRQDAAGRIAPGWQLLCQLLPAVPFPCLESSSGTGLFSGEGLKTCPGCPWGRGSSRERPQLGSPHPDSSHLRGLESPPAGREP